MRFILLSLYILLSGCIMPDDNPDTSAQLNTAKYLFEVEYVNYAWGFQHSGIYMDESGHIYHYQYTNSDTFQVLNKDEYTVEELRFKYSSNYEYIRQVGTDTLETMKDLVFNAIQGGFSDSLNLMADFGAISYRCFIYEDGTYYAKLIGENGDWEYHKQIEEATQLISFLEAVRESLESF